VNFVVNYSDPNYPVNLVANYFDWVHDKVHEVVIRYGSRQSSRISSSSLTPNVCS
jgi:hypothetical protein